MPLRLSPACCAMRRPHLGLTPPLHHPHPPGDFKTPTACASTRPVRTASAGVSYAPIKELRTQYQAAARLHLATKGMGIDAACEARGLTRRARTTTARTTGYRSTS